MEKFKHYLNDICKASVCGFIAAIAIGAITFIIGILVSGFNMQGTINIIRAGLFIVGSLGLFIAAAMLLSKKDMIILKDIDKWKKHFKKLNFVHVILVICTSILIAAALFDYLTFKL